MTTNPCVSKVAATSGSGVNQPGLRTPAMEEGREGPGYTDPSSSSGTISKDAKAPGDPGTMCEPMASGGTPVVVVVGDTAVVVEVGAVVGGVVVGGGVVVVSTALSVQAAATIASAIATTRTRLIAGSLLALGPLGRRRRTESLTLPFKTDRR